MSAASSASAFVGRVLIVSNNAVAIGQIKDSLQRFALFRTVSQAFFSSRAAEPGKI